MKHILITGSSGLIGSEVATYFSAMGYTVHGIDNNQRAVFFGPQGDTRWNQARLEKTLKGFKHYEIDIRDRDGILGLVQKIRPRLSCILRLSLPMIVQQRSRLTILTQMLWGR